VLCQLLPGQIQVMAHLSLVSLPYMAPLSFVHPVIHSTRHIAFHCQSFPKLCPTHSTFWLLYLPKIMLHPNICFSWYSPHLNKTSHKAFSVIFSLKNLILMSWFSFWFQTVSFSVPIYQCTSKMSHIIPSPDPNLTAPMFQAPPNMNISPKSSPKSTLEQGYPNCFL